ncbi:hypothetical protein HHL17_08865 [Chitinophaga sp. G-6-1-13]|uniref:PLL-like beta propeller domain-containing protein n=1 Tax=Chitinophaga fulva TaxID=2728842 RepID=A0A848GMY2_9BACT|nr:M57 family metalloprotease [Chitinophaga fulva]NML37308.1 hypothetical protein [Chitinophaga fulva]
MQKIFLLFLCCLLFCLSISCKQEHPGWTNDSGPVPASVLDRIKALGFSIKDLQRIDSGYLVERDILLYERDLGPAGPVLRIAETEQYRTTQLVTGLPRVLTVRTVGLSSAFVTAVRQAIDNYNALGLDLTFKYVIATSADITVQGACLSAGQLGFSGFPANGNPYPTITINTCSSQLGNNVDFIRHVVEHEMGHTIGLRHTDWSNTGYSCGSGSNEGAGTAGAFPIPGTPTGADAGSFMLACYSLGTIGDTSGSFNANDRLALEYLFRVPLATPCYSPPVAIARDANNMSVFAIGPANNLMHKSWNNTGKWSKWQLLGPISSIPAAVSRAAGFMDVFAKGPSNNLIHISWTLFKGWSAWEDLGGNIADAPVVNSRTPGVISVFARSAGNTLVTRTWTSGSGWSAWEDLGGNITSQPAVASRDANNVHVFAQTTNNNLTQITWSATGGWSAWNNLGGSIAGSPAVRSRTPQLLNIFARSVTNSLVTLNWTEGTGWSAWSDLGGSLSSDPVVVARDANNLQVFARNGSILINFNWTSTTGWSSSINLGGPINATPAAISRAPNFIDVFAANGTVMTTIFWISGSGWSAWGNI